MCSPSLLLSSCSFSGVLLQLIICIAIVLEDPARAGSLSREVLGWTVPK